MKLRDQRLQDEVIDLKPSDLVQFLGPNLDLHNCTIRCRIAAAALCVGDVTMTGGVFHAHKPLNNLSFLAGTFRGVTFKGRYNGCEWGSDQMPHNNGSVRDCDFSQAKLFLCGFRNSDLAGCTFPRWPHFLIDLRGVDRANPPAFDVPEELRFIVEMFYTSPENMSAICSDAAALVKKYGGDLEHFRAGLLKLPEVRITEPDL